MARGVVMDDYFTVRKVELLVIGVTFKQETHSKIQYFLNIHTVEE